MFKKPVAFAAGFFYCRIASSARIAQSVEQRTENPRVGGSIPSPGTFRNRFLFRIDKIGGFKVLLDKLGIFLNKNQVYNNDFW